MSSLIQVYPTAVPKCSALALCIKREIILQLCSHQVGGPLPPSEGPCPLEKVSSAKTAALLGAAARSCFLATCAPKANCFPHLSRFAVLLQSALKVFVKHFQASDMGKLGRNVLVGPDFPQSLYVPSALVKSCASLQLCHWQICTVLPSGHTETRIWPIGKQDTLR